jgi:hypothetical protein
LTLASGLQGASSMRFLTFVMGTLLVAACSGGGSDSAGGDQADEGGKPGDRVCADCKTDLDACLADANTGVGGGKGNDSNLCFLAFAECYVETTHTAVPCVGAGCSACEPCAEGPDQAACEVERSLCVVTTTEGDLACPGEAKATCADCEKTLAGCLDGAQDGFEVNQCFGAFGKCHVETTGQAVACPEGIDCSSCSVCDEGDVSGNLTGCLEDRSACILVDANGGSAAARCVAAN